MKYSIAIVFLLAAVAVAQPTQNCKALEDRGEKGIRKLLFTDKDSKIPTTEDEFNNYCNSGKELYKGLREYKTCLKPLPQEILNTATQSIAKVLKKHCGDKKGREEALKVLNCAGDNTLASLHRCAGQTLNVLEHLANDAAGSKKLVPQMCCMAHLTRECFEKELQSKCTGSDAPSIKEHFSQLVAAISKDVIELACDDLKNIRQCDTKMPDEMAKLRTIAQQPAGDLNSRLLVAPVIKIGEKVVE